MLIHWYRASNWLHKHHVPFLAKVIWKMSYLLFNSSLPPTAEIGQGTKLDMAESVLLFMVVQ